jgi:hypothetical protein
MRGHRVKRWALVGALCLACAAAYEAPGCVTFAATEGLAAIDFCSILDCQNGLLGGAVRLCGNPNDPTDDLLADCPNFDTTTNP